MTHWKFPQLQETRGRYSQVVYARGHNPWIQRGGPFAHGFCPKEGGGGPAPPISGLCRSSPSSQGVPSTGFRPKEAGGVSATHFWALPVVLPLLARGSVHRISPQGGGGVQRCPFLGSCRSLPPRKGLHPWSSRLKKDPSSPNRVAPVRFRVLPSGG